MNKQPFILKFDRQLSDDDFKNIRETLARAGIEDALLIEDDIELVEANKVAAINALRDCCLALIKHKAHIYYPEKVEDILNRIERLGSL